MRSTGWFGFPGDMTGNLSTKVHVVEDGKPICGSQIAPNRRYAWCAPGAEWGYIECERCKGVIRRELQENDDR